MRLVGLESHRRLMRLAILLAAVVLTVGCGSGSGDDPEPPVPSPKPDTPIPVPEPSEPSTPIVFTALQEEGEDVSLARQAAQGDTRATAPLEDQIASFKVWGYKEVSASTQIVFPGYTVTYVNAPHSTTTNSDGWEYVRQTPTEQTLKYWDWDVTAYRFFGVAPATATMTETDDEENHLKKFSFSVTNEEDTPYYSRLWYSTGVLPEYSSRQFGKPVQLEFVKPLSKVRFMYLFVSPREGVSMGEQTFKPTDDGKIIETGGTVTVSYPLTGEQKQETITVSNATGINALTEDYVENGTKKWYTVLPATGQGTYTLTVKVNDEDKTVVVPAAYMDWLPGYCYTYVFKIDAVGGVEIGWVDYAVTPWNTSIPAADHQVYNW